MKILIVLIVLTFSSWSIADDISNFQIEGISIGDSPLEYYTEEEINKKINSYNNKGFMYPSNEFYAITFSNADNFLTFDDVQFALKNNDESFKIYSIMGIINYISDLDDCFVKLDMIEDDFDRIFKNSNKVDRYEYSHKHDKSGKSKVTQVYYELENSSAAVASCADWSEELNIFDALRVTLQSKDFRRWINKVYD